MNLVIEIDISFVYGSWLVPGLLPRKWQISVSCLFSIFWLSSVFLLGPNQYNKAIFIVFLVLTGALGRLMSVCLFQTCLVLSIVIISLCCLSAGLSSLTQHSLRSILALSSLIYFIILRANFINLQEIKILCLFLYKNPCPTNIMNTKQYNILHKRKAQFLPCITLILKERNQTHVSTSLALTATNFL